MLKRTLIVLLALAFAVGSHLRVRCDYEVAGERIAPGCTCAAGRRALQAAASTAEEILPGPAELPAVRRRLRLSFGGSGGEAQALADAVLRATAGTVRGDEVLVRGERLGFVESGEALLAALDAYIGNTLPTWASGGELSAELCLRPAYTRAGRLVPEEDMLLLITGVASVLYYDGAGRYARA